MRIGSAFLKARDDKEDRIQKRRSDNMAAFNSYVKTQSELGVDASVQDLEQMKQNLAQIEKAYHTAKVAKKHPRNFSAQNRKPLVVSK